jgi:hypothetical protein
VTWPPTPAKWPPETVEACSEYYEAAYRMGNKDALIMMLGACAISGWPIPKWAGDIIVGAHDYAVHGMLGSWDELFGKPPTPKKGALLRDWQLRWYIHGEILVAQSKGEAIDDLLFERIGKKFGIGGKTKVKKIYKAASDELGRHLRQAKAPRSSNAGK